MEFSSLLFSALLFSFILDNLDKKRGKRALACKIQVLLRKGYGSER
jgi:hypothetical protein